MYVGNCACTFFDLEWSFVIPEVIFVMRSGCGNVGCAFLDLEWILASLVEMFDLEWILVGPFEVFVT